jgi:hypothetical protein
MFYGRNEAQFRQFAAERAEASRAPPPHSANSTQVANSNAVLCVRHRPCVPSSAMVTLAMSNAN